MTQILNFPNKSLNGNLTKTEIRLEALKKSYRNIFMNVLCELYNYDTQEDYDKKYKPTIDKITKEVQQIRIITDQATYEKQIFDLLAKYPKKIQRLYSIVTTIAFIEQI